MGMALLLYVDRLVLSEGGPFGEPVLCHFNRVHTTAKSKACRTGSASLSHVDNHSCSDQ